MKEKDGLLMTTTNYYSRKHKYVPNRVDQNADMLTMFSSELRSENQKQK